MNNKQIRLRIISLKIMLYSSYGCKDFIEPINNDKLKIQQGINKLYKQLK